jgi:hypothetical protein
MRGKRCAIDTGLIPTSCLFTWYTEPTPPNSSTSAQHGIFKLYPDGCPPHAGLEEACAQQSHIVEGVSSCGPA